MAPKGKSSASSGTRKKHARRAAGPADEQMLPLPNEKKGKKSKKEPKQKIFIAPVKPAPIQPDPLETTGLAHRLPPDLLVVLRSFGKKATVTKARALEELQSGWVDKCPKNDESHELVYTLVDMLPVWLHHLPALLVHFSRRIRLLTVTLHASLLQIPAIRSQMLFLLRESISAHQLESILGTWCVASHDIDRAVSNLAIKSWNDVIHGEAESSRDAQYLILDAKLLSPLLSFTQRLVLDPNQIYSELNPGPPPAPPPINHPSKKLVSRQAPSGKSTPGRQIRLPSGKLVSVANTPEALSGRTTPMAGTDGTGERSKTDEMEESDQDRKARMRVAAFGVLKWILENRSKTANLGDILGLFSNPLLWTSIHCAPLAPFLNTVADEEEHVESFGFSQPNVRKAAWTLIQTLVRGYKDLYIPLNEDSFLPILSAAILRSAWVETDSTVQAVMWQPLLMFLKEFPQAWDLEIAYHIPKLVQNQEDSDEEDDEDEEGGDEELHTADKPRLESKAYQEFLQFLQLGCSGSPLQGYPTVVIILSTISSNILGSTATPGSSPLTAFFTSFWAAIDGRALSSLNRSATSSAFLSSLLECMVFLVRRLRRNDAETHSFTHASVLLGVSLDPHGDGDEGVIDGNAESMTLVADQFKRVWEELSKKGLKVEETQAARIMAKTLITLEDISPDLFQAAWVPLAALINGSSTTTPSLVSAVLKAFDDHFAEGTGPKVATRTLIADVLQTVVEQCEKVLIGGVGTTDQPTDVKTGIAPVVSMLGVFGSKLFSDAGFSTRLDDITRDNSYLLLSISPSLLLAYFVHRQDVDRSLLLWRSLLSAISQHPTDIQTSLPPLLDAAVENTLPDYLKPQNDELDTLVGKLVANVLGGGATDELPLVQRILRYPVYFLSDDGFEALLQSITSSLTVEVDHALRDPGIPLNKFEAPLDLLRTVFEHQPTLSMSGQITTSLLPDVFTLAYLFPICFELENNRSVNLARGFWLSWVEKVPVKISTPVFVAIKKSLRSLLVNTQTLPKPDHIIRMLSEGIPGLAIDLLKDIFPSRDEIDGMLDDLSADPIDSSLAVLDPLVPPPSVFRRIRLQSQPHDRQGYSSYARVVGALLHVFVEQRQLAKENMWALYHFLALSLYASDLLRLPSSTSSPAFQALAIKSGLDETVSRVGRVSTYILTSSNDDTWRLEVVSALLEEGSKAVFNGLAGFLFDLIRRSSTTDSIRDSRIVYTVLQHILSDADEKEADMWIAYARRIEKTASQTCMAIVLAVTELALEPPRLDRYRNELAAAMLGIPAKKADTEGLLTLRKLAVTAPDPESDVIFLAQNRAVNVMKACQQWIASDEDLDEEVESAMTLVFFHLAPILQNVPGSHWDLIFDLVESNLENCSFADDSTLVILGRTLRLIIAIRDLALTNKSLRAEWQERHMAILTLVKQLVTAKLVNLHASSPRSACRELALSIVEDLPASLIDEETLPQMCHLLTDTSISVQKMAYQLLHGAAKRRTEHLVIEAGVDVDAVVKADLPHELLEILQRSLNQADGSEHDEHFLLGYLLGWMILFDLFVDASLKVRSSYIDQLRDLDVIAGHFIPNIFTLLHLDEGLSKAFKLDPWAVDEFHVQFYEPGTSFSLQLLAAHLYYRALLTVPSLIHTWVLDCKDRQLSTSIISYTSQHFSPVIIRAELMHVKSPETTAELVDDQLTIKVSNNVNEVTASYLVDEHQLEIKFKIPSDWPLHKIEIKDLRRVGVDENRWRAWILAVQQTISSHNGHIVDGLSLFKKNVTLHFEGQVECAICYSIISVMDGSLPRKPCRTCKNRFHAGCLFKWFSSSHSSSCPLCRSDIF